jgi:hypothetical protein
MKNKETTAPMPTAEAAEPTGTRNPATFTPSAPGGISIDRDLLIKGVGLMVALIIVIVVAVFFLVGRGEKRPAAPTVPQSADASWVRPQTGEPYITLVAVDRTQVTAQAESGAVLYQGTLQRGDRRDVPRRGKLKINSEAPENLRVAIDGKEWELKDSKGTYLRSSEIVAPSPR